MSKVLQHSKNNNPIQNAGPVVRTAGPCFLPRITVSFHHNNPHSISKVAYETGNLNFILSLRSDLRDLNNRDPISDLIAEIHWANGMPTSNQRQSPLAITHCRVLERNDSSPIQIAPTGSTSGTAGLLNDNPQRALSKKDAAEKWTVRGAVKNCNLDRGRCDVLTLNTPQPKRDIQLTDRQPSFVGDCFLKAGPENPQGSNQILSCCICVSTSQMNNRYRSALSSIVMLNDPKKIASLKFSTSPLMTKWHYKFYSHMMDAIRSHCSSLCKSRGPATISSAII